ncbi:hypothetical protein DUNSADRAFT_17808 [Dunaliella salina]|uniref:Capsule synthesis protein CapA domain-containing protein n=1 Tax=Dunaliella salina TaxID=3046 RepID=A0ABQ7GZP0_DUNSA|nr:hypothetical protein DUNSADRAFT_17808 [Dunaliella salina]|eukprot:KAF5840074.1 hypothetical protein DUNSADRAFT_17808 [Dunaliella salina]
MASPPRGPVTRPLQICMGGDTMLGRIVDKGLSFDTKRKTLVWGDVLSWIADKKLRARQEGGAFILAGNLECAITNETRENPKAFNFRLLKENADVLSIPQFDFVSLANNHILDYWRQGLLDTIETLSDLGIAHAGAGTLPDAKRAAVMRKAVDISPQPQGAPPPPVAFVSLSDHYHQWAATHNEPGINFVDPENFKKEDIQEQISLARSALGPDHAAGLVIAFLHWGPNWRWEPEESLQRVLKRTRASRSCTVQAASLMIMPLMRTTGTTWAAFTICVWSQGTCGWRASHAASRISCKQVCYKEVIDILLS